MILEKKQLKIFWILVTVFLISYIVMIIFILQIKGNQKHSNKFDRKAIVSKFLKNDIGFTSRQLLQYDSISKAHQQEVSGIWDSMRNNKNVQFKLLTAANFNDSAIQIAVEKTVTAQKMMELNQLYYIKSIRLLCTPAQTIVFDTTYYKLMNRRGHGREKQNNKK